MKNIYMRLQKTVPILIFGSLLLTVALLSLRRIHLVTADLGRHIANGRALLTQGAVIDSNFYSYSFPETAFVNHHWASGLVFYWFHQAAGFIGLSYLHMALTTGAFGLIFLLSWRLTSIIDCMPSSSHDSLGEPAHLFLHGVTFNWCFWARYQRQKAA